MTELIYDIEKFCKDFKFSKVRIFVPASYALSSLAAASALATYLIRVCHIDTMLVADQERVNQVSMCLPLVEDPDSIPRNANNFLAVIIDCADPSACDNDSWNKTFCGFQVRGGVSMKDFGTEAYNYSEGLCAAEIIFQAIKKHSEETDQWCPECWNYLYLAMLDATSQFKLHMKTNTFEVIQDLINLGANHEIKPECFKTKITEEIIVLEKLYTDNIIEKEVGRIVFDEAEWKTFSSYSFQNVLEYMRFIKLVNIWLAFVRTKKGYKVFVQGNASGKFDCTKMLKDYEGTGSRKKARCNIRYDQIDEIVELAQRTVEESKIKEKPRKKYTHKNQEIEEE